MSILIKGMTMPKACLACDFCNPFAEEPYCRRLMKRVPMVTRLAGCPFVELPPHGRLIDADDLLKVMDNGIKEESFKGFMFRRIVEQIIDNAPTIIESEGEDG